MSPRRSAAEMDVHLVLSAVATTRDVVDAGDEKSGITHERNNGRGQRLALVELDKGAFDVRLADLLQCRSGASQNPQLGALCVDLQKAGPTDVKVKIIEPRRADFHRAGRTHPIELLAHPMSHGQHRGGIVARSDEEWSRSGVLVQGGGVNFEVKPCCYTAERRNGCWQRLEADDPRVGTAVAHQRGKLPSRGSYIEHRGCVTKRHPNVL